jgi:hypothetical protein
VIITCEFGGAIWALTSSFKFEDEMAKAMEESFFSYTTNKSAAVAVKWKSLQQQVIYVPVTVHRDNLRINNQQDAPNIQSFILLRNSTYFGHLLCPSSGLQPDSPRKRPHTRNLHETYQLPRVQLITPDDGHSRCPKHVEFRNKIKCWILDASCWLFIRRTAGNISICLLQTLSHI